MLRLTRKLIGNTAKWTGALATGLMTLAAGSATAEPPRAMQDLDLAASGFVMPASGQIPAGAYAPYESGVSQAGYMAGPSAYNPMAGPSAYNPMASRAAMPMSATGSMPISAGGVMPVGYFASACDAGSCDGMGGYGEMGACGCGPMGNCGSGGCNLFGNGGQCPIRPIAHGGLLGAMMGNSCGDTGFSDCQRLCGGALLSCWEGLKPYSEAGRCAQRWYDFSIEGMWLGHTDQTFGGINGVITTNGSDDPVLPGLQATPVLTTGSTELGDLEGGVRISGAMIFGPGGNIELTYIGGHEWEETATAQDPGANLFSFVSAFGTDPLNGFDDTDRSLSQSLRTKSVFHSGEINYRRRVVDPCCRYQGSWLLGLRYVRFDNTAGFSATGLNNNALANNGPRFFEVGNQLKNNMFGVQTGGDVWCTLIPGVSLGMGGKLGWVANDIDQTLSATGNSIATSSVERHISDSTLLAELEFSLLYRLTHSWTAKSSYFLLGVDEMAVAGIDANAANVAASGGGLAPSPITLDSMVLQGFSFGAEYTW